MPLEGSTAMAYIVGMTTIKRTQYETAVAEAAEKLALVRLAFELAPDKDGPLYTAGKSCLEEAETIFDDGECARCMTEVHRWCDLAVTHAGPSVEVTRGRRPMWAAPAAHTEPLDTGNVTVASIESEDVHGYPEIDRFRLETFDLQVISGWTGDTDSVGVPVEKQGTIYYAGQLVGQVQGPKTAELLGYPPIRGHRVVSYRRVDGGWDHFYSNDTRHGFALLLANRARADHAKGAS